jgi:hypothetical protein
MREVGQRRQNRLAGETSPYLLQHAGNPVDWYPWGAEAFAAARERNVPLLLSVGYSACHWCHVMERESFEHDAIAEQMNRLFVCVKVDREERPDVDATYMDAVVSLSGQGGWPMTVFLTPDGRPFWGGTYFPPEQRGGMPGFPQVLDAVAEVYRARPEDVERQADQITTAIAAGLPAHDDGEPSRAAVEAALSALRRQFDTTHGGFGGAPKFPPSALLPTLLALPDRSDALAMAGATLDAMAAGGIHDQLGGGFHRYAVDGRWLVPHFEKMLYDNALLASAYAAGAAVLDEPPFADVARGVLAYMERELRLPEGGFASAQDADTEGEEGLTFTWTPAQVRAVLGDGEEAEAALGVYGIDDAGNFEGGATVLSLVRRVEDAEAPALARARAALLAARAERPQPARDDKALAAWNGLALAALADSARLLAEPAYAERGRELAAFLLGPLSASDGRLLRTFRAGTAKIGGFSDDYGAVAHGLIALHAATGDLGYLEEARRLTALALALFDDDAGGFFLAPVDGEPLVARKKDVDDNPAPSGTSLIAGNLLRLGRIYGLPAWEERAALVVRGLQGTAARAPQAFGHLLGVQLALLEPSRELAIVGPPDDPRTRALRAVVDARHEPFARVVVVADPADPRAAAVPLLEGKGLVDGAPAAYVCERMACRRPVTTADELATLLG